MLPAAQERRVGAGAILLVLGVGLLALQFVEGYGQVVVLLFIGGVFVAAYLWRRFSTRGVAGPSRGSGYGLLVPGCILLGLGLGSAGKQSGFGPGDLEAIGLGVGFIAIYVVDSIVRGRSHWWPLVPGVILVGAGVAQASAEARRLLSLGWPLALVLVGLLLLVGVFGRRPSPPGP